MLQSNNRTLKNRYIQKNKKTAKCAPGIGNNFSCFDAKSIKNIASEWNRSNPYEKINITKNSKDNWKKINNKLEGCNGEEWCWINQDFIKKTNNNNAQYSKLFRPKMPNSWLKEKRKWLTTTDIDSVMRQYEENMPEFKFIGPAPIDFDYEYNVGLCIVDELCRLNIKKLYSKGVHKLGMVFNLDSHDEPGSHWVSLYSDFNLGEVYYFDSYGIFPPDEIRILMERLRDQGRLLKGKPFKLYYNDIRHQFKNSECGVYSINFISQFLEGRKFKDIVKDIVSDDKMNKKRNYFYRV
jgi:hypothetical protein